MGDYSTEECADRHYSPDESASSPVDTSIQLRRNKYLVTRHQQDVPVSDEESRDKTNRSKDPVIGGKPLKKNCDR